MNINIEKKNFEKLNINEWKGKCGQALDALWESPWVRMSIGKSDRRTADALQDIAGTISGQSDVVLVIASGAIARLIKAAVSAVSQTENGAEVLVFGDTLAPAEYERVLEHLDGNDFSILAVTEGEEDLQEKAAYTCLKQLLVKRYGKEIAVERIYAIAGSKSKMIAQDAADNDYPLMNYPDEIPTAYGANTSAVLLPLAIKGYSLEEYLEGFYEMLASPAWDLDGADYAIAKAVYGKETGAAEEFLIWQNQLADFGAWMGSVRQMPAGGALIDGDAFATHLICEEDEADIMMPYFEGCSMEGSLNALMKETAAKCFADGGGEAPAVKISVEKMDAFNLGQLMAFFQLSRGIAEFLVK